MNVFDFVVDEILLVDSVQTSYVGVTLMLEGCPIKGSALFERKAISSCIIECLSYRGSVPGDWSNSVRT